MKTDLDDEMEIRNIDWIVISGARYCNPDIVYLIGEANVMNPFIIKKKGEEYLVIHNSMERGEVEKHGLNGIDYDEIFPRKEQERIQDVSERMIAFYMRLFSRFKIKGRVAFYGVGNIHSSYAVLNELFRKCHSIRPVFDLNSSIFQYLRLTKDSSELEIIRDVTKKTCTIFNKLLAFIKGQKVRDNRLVGSEGNKITLGDLRRHTYVQMAELGLITHDLPIISSGRDAGIPHSKGDDSLPVEIGRPIILDIYPRCARTGYMSDITRTICVGKAPEKIKSLYSLVREAQRLAISEVGIEKRMASADEKVSKFFERNGFSTLHSDFSAKEGYVHALGHGIGLELHEPPRISIFNADKVSGRFRPGMVFTLEPGLYFPDEGMGIRLEDVFYLNENDELEILTDLEQVLEVIPVG